METLVTKMTPEQTARRCAEIMWPDDHAARGLGIEVANPRGKLIAIFRGRSTRIKVHFFEMPDNAAPPEGR
ncbi:MAG: hypothetical protein Q8O25_05440 [Sulfurisoma sp.]|nr:hypothetical protein [Sulfurisoma sp.]